MLDAAAADKGDVRVFTVGFGQAVDRAAARAPGRAQARALHLHRGRRGHREQVTTLYRQIDAPVLVDVSLEVKGGAASRVYPPTLPDLFPDDELRISGRLRGAGTVVFTLKGKAGGKPVTYTRRSTCRRSAPPLGRPDVGRGARRRPARRDRAPGTRPELSDEMIELALAYNFVTPYTAFLAIPESELGAASASQLNSARMRKADILRRRPEAIGVRGGDAREQVQRPMADASAPNAAPPPPPPRDTSHPRKMASADSEELLAGAEASPVSRRGRRRAPGSQEGDVGLVTQASRWLHELPPRRRRLGNGTGTDPAARRLCHRTATLAVNGCPSGSRSFAAGSQLDSPNIDCVYSGGRRHCVGECAWSEASCSGRWCSAGSPLRDVAAAPGGGRRARGASEH